MNRALFLGVSVPLYALLAALSFRGVVLHGPADVAAQSIFNHEYDYPLQWAYVGVGLALSVTWLWGIRHFSALGLSGRGVLAVGALLGGLSLAAYPGVNSNDMMAYVGFGRIWAVHRLNPWTHGFGDVIDWYAPYAWYPFAMPYGPVAGLFLVLAGYVSTVSVPLAFYFLKLCWLAAHLCAGWLVLRIARANGLDGPRAAFTYLACPLILIEIVNNGHCDVLLVVLSLASLERLMCTDTLRGASMAVVLGVLACLVKPTAVLLLLAEGAWLLRSGRGVALAWGALFACCAAGGLALTIFASPEARAALTNPHILTNAHSFHSVLIHLRHASYLTVYEGEDFKATRAMVSFLFALLCLWRAACIRTRRDVVREYLGMTLALMLFYSARVWPWYTSWLLPFAAVTDSRPLRRSMLLYCVSMFAVYALPFALLWQSLFWHAMRVLLSSGLPLMLLAYELLRRDTATDEQTSTPPSHDDSEPLYA